ncbi:HD-GYP domain-containing protein, partial [Thermodesulfobacteriota bacterium]
HHVITTKNGLDALEKFLSGNIDIVITDWNMPEMDGLELVRHISKHSSDKPYVYTIFLTSRSDKGDVVAALSEEGVDDYLIKPFDPDELRARIGVGERTVRLERALQEYGQGLEKIVQKQTRIIRQTQEETIYRLLTTLETRDEETGGHVRRIALASVRLAEAVGWDADNREDLRLSAPMHDIGKIGVPDAILCKKGKLTFEEFEVMKTHTSIGGQILGGSQFPMLQLAHDIAMSHHEKWNGKGYPKGLAGEEIPQVGRIVALVDVFDALGHDRVYHKAAPEEEVIRIMQAGRGTHFDSNLYDLFIDLLPEIRSIAAENP